MRVLVIGATGMIGHSVFREFDNDPDFEAWGTSRQASDSRNCFGRNPNRWLSEVAIMDRDCMARTIERVRPDVVVNAVGVVKQLDAAKDPLTALPVNALLPHRLALSCKMVGARLVHISTDCVFLGDKGNYDEQDRPDADDLYGRSKALGEIADQEHVITLRTSTVGHEIGTSHGLLEWFLRQGEVANGYTKAIFSGLPTVEFAKVIKDVVCPLEGLHGLYNVAGDPISKYDFLTLVAKVYGKQVSIRAVEDPAIDRTLDSSRFREATGYQPAQWPELVEFMHARYKQELAT